LYVAVDWRWKGFRPRRTRIRRTEPHLRFSSLRCMGLGRRTPVSPPPLFFQKPGGFQPTPADGRGQREPPEPQPIQRVNGKSRASPQFPKDYGSISIPAASTTLRRAQSALWRVSSVARAASEGGPPCAGLRWRGRRSGGRALSCFPAPSGRAPGVLALLFRATDFEGAGGNVDGS